MANTVSSVAPFEKRSRHSSRCSDQVWDEAQKAAVLAGCSMSVFHEVALQLLTQIVKERGIKLENYDAEARWVAEFLSRIDQPRSRS